MTPHATNRIYFKKILDGRIFRLGSSKINFGLHYLAISLLVAGCSSLKGLNPQGCIDGTVVGSAIGGLISKKGAIIGAIGGCIAGLFVGDYFDKRKEQYASQQEAIFEETAWNRNMARKLRQTNAKLENSIQQYKQELERINNMRMNDKQRQWLLRKQQKRFQQQFGKTLVIAERLKIELNKSNERYQQYQANANPAALAEWQTEITAFEQAGNRLDDKLNRLVAMNDSLWGL
jgi:hypothetical protein